MKVLYDFQIFALQQRGGVSRYFVSLWQEFQKSGEIDPELFLGLNQTALASEIPATVRVRGLQAKDPLLPKTRWLAWALNGTLCRRALRASSADIYHPTYFWLPQDIGSKALVLTVYDLVHELFPHLFIPQDYIFRWRPEAVRRADVILAISETTKRDLCERYRVPPDRVFVTPLGCSLPPLDQLPLLNSPEQPSLLYVGERGGYKNFAVLAAAWRQSEWLRREFKLVCFGGLEPSADEVALPGTVEFRRGDDQALAAAYRQASALIYPSLYEGFGLPVLEAFHYGCPVLTSGCGSIREVAGEAAAYFEVAAADSLEEELRRLLTDSSGRQELINRGHLRGRHFSWQRCAEGTVRAYRAALTQRSRPIRPTAIAGHSG